MLWKMSTELLLTSLIVKISAIEKILVEKNLVSETELNDKVKELTLIIAKEVLQKANVKDIDQVLKNIGENSKNAIYNE